MKYLRAIAPSAWLAKLLYGAALLCMVAGANADQLLVTGANRDGNAVYDLGISPSNSTPVTPVIASTITQINSDGAAHGAFDALVWVPNSYCQSLDLIAADASKGQIVRYAGANTQPGASSPATCYKPPNGTPPSSPAATVSPTAQVIFKWSKLGSGPAQPNGLSVDANGNVFVVSSSGLFDPKPSVWVLPFNASASQYCSGASGAAGGYCPPVLIDAKFGGTLTLALADTLVASTSAVTSTKTVLWSAGDLLVLVGDSFDARLMVYSHTKLYNSNGLLAIGAMPLSAPTSTPIPWLKFLGQLAAPFGMDLWPANATLGTNASVLFTTIDGRILRFDTVQNKFVTDFADRLGLGLQKLKVGSYANVPYAFVAQLQANNTGQILEFGAPPASGPANNKPLAKVTQGIMIPMGLAIAYSGSQSVPGATNGNTPCAPPNAPCVFAPLGPELVSTLSAYPGDNVSGTVQEQNCIVQSDPRVHITNGVWSCTQAALNIGAGTGYCPTFPAAVIPGSVCGHSGLTGSGFAVIEGTATGIDPNDNNSFITTAGSVDTVLPGPTNLECTGLNGFAVTHQIPLIAWGPRSDVPNIEGTIPEDSTFGTPTTIGPPFAGQPGYLTELTGACDSSSTGSRELSIFAIGLGLSNTLQSYVYTLQNEKYEALEQTVASANITNYYPSDVQSTLAGDISTAENYVTAAQSANFTNNIKCALNEIAATDSYLRGYLPAFSSNLGTPPGGGNANPAGDIDGRLANWYTVLNTMLAGNAPYASWPLPAASVPACVYSTQPEITSFSLQRSAGSDTLLWTSINTIGGDETPPAGCTISSLYAGNPNPSGYFPNSVAGQSPDESDNNFYYATSTSYVGTPPDAYPGWGSDTYTLTCYGAPGTTPATASILNNSGFTATTNAPLSIPIFVTDGNGDLGWMTVNSTPGTTCTITDAYGGTPYNQGPAEYLPPNQPLPDGDESVLGYYYFSNAFCSETPQYTDTLTLTCSDPTNGTAMSTLLLTFPGCEE